MWSSWGSKSATSEYRLGPSRAENWKVSIELNTLITILVGMVSIVVSTPKTWYFSKWHYSARAPVSKTQNYLALKEIKNEGSDNTLGFLSPLLCIMGLPAFFVFLAVFTGTRVGNDVVEVESDLIPQEERIVPNETLMP